VIRPEYIIEELRNYMPDADFDMVWRAYAFAARCHKGQKRVFGEPYLSHPLEVAHILTGMKLGYISICVGLMHDTLEDADTTEEEIKDLFGDEVFLLVDGVTKISKLQFSSKEERQSENMRKMTLAEREAYVGQMLAKRKAIQDEIKKLNAEREKYVAAKRKAIRQAEALASKANTTG